MATATKNDPARFLLDTGPRLHTENGVQQDGTALRTPGAGTLSASQQAWEDEDGAYAVTSVTLFQTEQDALLPARTVSANLLRDHEKVAVAVGTCGRDEETNVWVSREVKGYLTVETARALYEALGKALEAA